MKHILAGAALAAATVLAPAAQAQSTQTTEVESGSGQRAIALGYGAPLGQTFTSTGTSLDSFGFEFSVLNPGFANLPVTLTIRDGDGLTGNVIATSTLTPAGLPTANRETGWLDFAFTGADLVDGNTYSAVLTSSSYLYGLVYGPDINIFTGQALGPDAYAGGHFFDSDGYADPVCATGICDANFRFTTSAAAAAVPEPATWGLMILGFGAVGATIRRRSATVRFA